MEPSLSIWFLIHKHRNRKVCYKWPWTEMKSVSSTFSTFRLIQRFQWWKSEWKTTTKKVRKCWQTNTMFICNQNWKFHSKPKPIRFIKLSVFLLLHISIRFFPVVAIVFKFLLLCGNCKTRSLFILNLKILPLPHQFICVGKKENDSKRET